MIYVQHRQGIPAYYRDCGWPTDLRLSVDALLMLRFDLRSARALTMRPDNLATIRAALTLTYDNGHDHRLLCLTVRVNEDRSMAGPPSQQRQGHLVKLSCRYFPLCLLVANALFTVASLGPDHD